MKMARRIFGLFFQFLVLKLIVVAAQKDGSSPEEVCPCQEEASCKVADKRHVFGSDQLDITKFGLHSPCSKTGHFPCCPENPPPAKEIKLTAKDLQGFSQAELIELGVLNDKGTIIGTSILPLSTNDKFQPLTQNSFGDFAKLPGASSLPPLGVQAPQMQRPAMTSYTPQMQRPAMTPYTPQIQGPFFLTPSIYKYANKKIHQVPTLYKFYQPIKLIRMGLRP